MVKVLPHEAFRFDFNMILAEGKRQEEIHSANVGEFALVQNMHACFNSEILPCIVEDDWVFEAASRFANEYAGDCFRYLRLGGQEVYRTQQQLHDINSRVTDFLVEAYQSGLAPQAVSVDIAKASDFINLVEVDRLDPETRALTFSLREEAMDHEELQLTVTLRAIRDCYETNITRIMFVVRRALKVAWHLSRKRSDDKLLSPSDYIDWYIANANSEHPFFAVLGSGQQFYRVARNVGNHHIGLEWQEGTDTVILQDRDFSLPVHVHRFQQWFRYLTHFSELGVRGILAAFCERERGPISMALTEKYDKTFPPDWDGALARVVIPYPE